MSEQNTQTPETEVTPGSIARDEHAAYAAKELMDQSVKKAADAKAYEQQQTDAFMNGVYAKMDMAAGSLRAAMELWGREHTRDYNMAGQIAELSHDSSEAYRRAAEKVIETAYTNYDAGKPGAHIDTAAAFADASRDVAQAKAAAKVEQATGRLNAEKSREAKGLPHRIVNLGRVALAALALHNAKHDLHDMTAQDAPRSDILH